MRVGGAGSAGGGVFEGGCDELTTLRSGGSPLVLWGVMKCER